MNPRRVHELMSAHFPKLDAASHTWVNVVEADASLRRPALASLIDRFIGADEVLVEVNRKLGGLLHRKEVLDYVARHVLQGDIRLAGRDFHGYVVVAASGVATGGPG